MRNWKRIVSMILFLCIIVSLTPPVQFAGAATIKRYELDTDGIDVGAAYLIVNTKTAGTGNALRFYFQNSQNCSFQNQTLTVQTANGVSFIDTGFVNEEDCKFQFSSTDTGKITHDDFLVDLSKAVFANSSYYKLTFAKGENGAYQIYYTSTFPYTQKYYLTYNDSNNAKWGRSSTSCSVYLFKEVEHEASCNITFDGNGNTAGQAPAAVTLDSGSTYTIPAAPEGFVKDGYIFSHWTDDQAGNGAKYFPGDSITATGDLQLYAQWTLIPKYQLTVTTKLDGNNADISAIASDTVGLYFGLDGGDGMLTLLQQTEAGVYTATVMENGTYSVYILKTDYAYEDTGYDVAINNADGAAELAYYTVSYNLNGGALDTQSLETVYPAGSQVTALDKQPTLAGQAFLGWMDQDNNLYAPGAVITGSLQERITLYAMWNQAESVSYVIRYLEKGTYKELLPQITVEGSAEGVTVMANQQVQSIVGHTYVGAGIGGQYYEKEREPYMTLSEDTSQNVLVLFYNPDPDLHLHKEAILEDNGTYTIELDMFTHNNPVTTLVDQDIPLDIVLVLDQSSSMYTGGVLDDLQASVTNFIDLVAEHGRTHQTDHRIAIVGYGSNGEVSGGAGNGPVAGAYYNKQTVTNRSGTYTNTGVFGAHGNFHAYPITGFTYEKYEGKVEAPAEGVADQDAEAYYTFADGEFLLLTYHSVYRHVITEEEAYTEYLQGEDIYGYIDGEFVLLNRNANGMWVTDSKILYSEPEFFTRHEKVWTHRHGIEAREIHAYMIDGVFTPVGDHKDVYIRKETIGTPDKSIYRDALIPVTMGAQGSGYVDFAFDEAVSNLGAKGQTYVSLGMEMANRIFEANPLEELNEDVERQRVIVVFTDGKPGDSASFNETESNAALALAEIAQREYGAQIFTIGLYGDSATDANADAERTKKDQEDFLMGLSSNYPEATKLEDVWKTVTYIPASAGFRLTDGGPYYVQVDGNYYPLKQAEKNDYLGKDDNGNYVYRIKWCYEAVPGEITVAFSYLTTAVPTIGADGVTIGENDSTVTIYRKSGTGYKEAASHNYYFGAQDSSQLEEEFATIVQELTTKISTEVAMKDDAILRDIMGQGLVLTENTVISVYKQPGTFITAEKRVEWSDEKILLDQLVIPANPADTLYSDKSITVDGVQIPYISVYNLNASNPTDPAGEDYHPHTVDIVGYEYNNKEWYMNAETPDGARLVVTITHVEARDDVAWNRAQSTNNSQSGLWLPATEDSGRELLEAFVEPSTVFVERAYVLDYGKEFTLSDWYFDDEDGKEATPIHLDFNIENGMNLFDPSDPATANAKGDMVYGNAQMKDGKVTYSPTSMNWGGYDQFYVFGNTWRKTVHDQSANQNGNLWNKVTVIPANNIYYEDSFITTEDTDRNGIEGFTFTGEWTVVGQDSGNTEVPEHVESAPYGDVHGWTDSLGDDLTYTDGSAHATGLNGEMGAKAEFTFTGTGVEVYTRTNAKSGMVVAVLNRKTVDGDGKETANLVKSIAIDNLAVSGDYYHIPTVAFKDLDYGTYTLQLIATAANAAVEGLRYEYCIDGVRIHNPLGSDTDYLPNDVKNAYGLETNAVFTEVRDILLDYGDFNTELPDSNDGKMGAVFIDWIREGQGSGNDQTGVGVPTYEIGTFETYGPKNEVYLSAGQAIVLKVAEGNTYYVGLKSLTGAQVTANVSGIDDLTTPTAITIGHSTDMYYRVNPINGYIVIQNGNTDGALLSITNLRATNLTAAAENGGILPVAQQEAVRAMRSFTEKLLANQSEQQNKPQPSDPQVEGSVMQQTEINLLLANALFASVRRWMKIAI